MQPNSSEVGESDSPLPTKTCPFCRETVREAAIKCRYCGSSLFASKLDDDAPAKVTEVAASPDQVVYVLDRGLLRFAKFVGGALAIFGTLGVLLYGFDIKRMHDQIREIRDDAEKTATETKKTADALVVAKSDLQAAKGDLTRANAEAKQLLAKLELQEAEGETRIAHIKQLTDPEVAASAQFVAVTTSPSVAGAPHSMNVRQLLRLYKFPPALRGRGQTVALIELGGGYLSTDLKTFFADLKVPPPHVISVSVDGATNSFVDGGDSSQVTSDIEIVGAVAPASTIIVYFSTNTNAGFVKAIERAVHDEIHRPSVISIGWGGPESSWSTAGIAAMNLALQSAQTRGITVLAAAGDSGATDGLNDGKRHVDFPASSPWVTACGGSTVLMSGQSLTGERAWNNPIGGTGGGVSDLNALPLWQATVTVPRRADGSAGRGLPDVAANADPFSGYNLVVSGHRVVVGGTSLATPFWAGAVALLNEGLGHSIGYLNPLIYRVAGPGGAFHDITDGDNSIGGVVGYKAGRGWDAVSGWGSPDGEKLLQALRAIKPP